MATTPQRRRHRSKPQGEVWMKLKNRELMARLMQEHGYSQRKLAEESGFATHTYLGQLMRGEETTCTAARAVAISALLKIPVDTLFVSNLSTQGARPVQRRERTPEQPDVSAQERSFRTAGAA